MRRKLTPAIYQASTNRMILLTKPAATQLPLTATTLDSRDSPRKGCWWSTSSLRNPMYHPAY